MLTKACFFISIFLISSLLAKQIEVDVEAKSALLMNADTGRILFEKNSKEISFPASTTKIATALFLLDHKRPPLDKMISPSYDCLVMNDPKLTEAGIRKPMYRLDYDGTMMGVKKGETLSIEALIHGMMLVSGNDASNALAEHVSGSIDKFVEELNQYVKSIGCTQTHFCNPHGLHHPDHVSTPYDLALVMQRALKNPDVRKVMAAKSYSCPDSNKQAARELFHTNRLIRPGKYNYPHTICGKTGYTSKAQNNFVVAAEKEGRTLIAVLLGTKTKRKNFEDSVKLFKAAFDEEKVKRLMVRSGNHYEREVKGASSTLTGLLNEDLYVEYFPSEEPQLKAFVYWSDLKLPVSKGAVVGEVRVVDERQQVIGSAKLLSADDVKKTFICSLMDYFKGIFSKK
jgi:serine-type D-Ala-D-Ala carboxypeptidase (penicillin-binding protein 5/6)